MSKVSSQVGFEVPQYISHVHRVVTSYCIQLSLSNISPLGGTYWITTTMSQSMYFYLFHAKFQFSVGQSVDPQTILSTSTLKNRPFFLSSTADSDSGFPRFPGGNKFWWSWPSSPERLVKSSTVVMSSQEQQQQQQTTTAKHQDTKTKAKTNNLNPKLWLLPYNKFYDSSTSMMTKRWGEQDNDTESRNSNTDSNRKRMHLDGPRVKQN